MEVHRRQELASFLRARREALTPLQIGLPPTARRRVKGLRREEVAEAAGISTAWYTWIEQARDLNLSGETLDKLSRALHLNPSERSHLFELAGHAAPVPRAGHSEQVMESVRAVILSMDPNPSYALDSYWNVVAWNRGASSLFGDFGQLSAAERNFVRLTFCSPPFRALFLNWEEVAHCVMANFRSDSAAQVDHPQWLQLVDDLNGQSAEFREWWPRHHVAWPHSWHKEVDHPKLGRLAFNTFDLELFRPARLRIVTYIPAAPSTGK